MDKTYLINQLKMICKYDNIRKIATGQGVITQLVSY